MDEQRDREQCPNVRVYHKHFSVLIHVIPPDVEPKDSVSGPKGLTKGSDKRVDIPQCDHSDSILI